jgi:hypothetical protein
VKIKMLARIEGTRNAIRWPDAGTVLSLPDGEARDLIATGLAVAVEDEAPALEKKVAPKPTTRRKG